jgi:hypothetical protein
MRLSILDRGDTRRARLWIWLLDKALGHAPDVIRTVMHRPEYFGRTLLAATQAVMREPSPWTVGERELFAAYTSRLNQCPF